jgi:hypothetical protein
MPIASKPFEIVYFDMIVLKSDAWNHQRYISHFYDAATKTHWAVHHLDKKGSIRAVLYMVNAVERRYNCKLKTLHSDGEKSLLTGELDFLNSHYGLQLNVTVPDTPEQNGPAERAGGVLMKRARALHLESGLPPYLEGEAIKASVYVMNRTPTRDANNAWFLPLQRLYDLLDIPRTVDMSNMYLYGCMAFYRRKTMASHKLEPRAGIGYLIGYEAHNIWRIWNPKAKPKWSVFRARDVVFDESRKYQKDDPLLTAELRYSEPLATRSEATDENPYNIVNLPFFVGLEDDPESDVSYGPNEPSNSSNNQEMVEVCDLEDQPQEGEVQGVEAVDDAIQSISQQETGGIMPGVMPQSQPTNEIPSSSESFNQETVFEPHQQSDAETPPTSVDGRAFPEDNENTNFNLPGGLPKLGEDDKDDEDGYTTPTPHSPAESDNGRPQNNDFDKDDVDASPIENNDEVMEDAPPLGWYNSVVPMKRSSARIAGKLAENRTKMNRTHYTQLLQAKVDHYTPFYIAMSFAVRQSKLRPADMVMSNLHKSNIPKAPESWNELLRHPLRNQFQDAMQVEWDDLWKFGVFETVRIPKRKLVIPVRWVFAYKFDAEGHVTKFKARLVVRGDLQPYTRTDTAAATLAARVFRLMMALAAAWDLEIMQFDVQNAFIQGLIDEEVYVEFPNG